MSVKLQQSGKQHIPMARDKCTRVSHRYTRKEELLTRVEERQRHIEIVHLRDYRTLVSTALPMPDVNILLNVTATNTIRK